MRPRARGRYAAVTGAKPLALLIAVLLGSPGALAADGGSHCRHDEQVVFACALGRKLVSVCGTIGMPGATYRYGPPGHPELVLPEPAAPQATTLAAGSLTFSGGGGAYLRYRRAGYDYIVFAAVGRGWGEKEGVVVEKEGQRIAYLRCRGGTRSLLGPEWFQAAEIPEDANGFDLP